MPTLSFARPVRQDSRLPVDIFDAAGRQVSTYEVPDPRDAFVRYFNAGEAANIAPAGRLRAIKPDHATLIRNTETGSLRLQFEVGQTTFEVRVYMPETIDDETHEALSGAQYPVGEPVRTQQITLWLDASGGKKSPDVMVYAAKQRRAKRR